MLRVVWTLGFTGAFHRDVIGQQRCGSLIQSIPKLKPDMRDSLWFHLYVQMLKISQQTASEALASVREATDLSVDVRTVGDSLLASLKKDSAQEKYLPDILATIMSAEDLKLGDAQAVVASNLYEHWKLGPHSALSILADPRQRPRARLLALRAVRGLERDSAFEDATLAAICSIAASAAGTRSLGLVRHDEPLSRVLNADDLSLFMEIKSAIARRGNSAHTLRRIQGLLPQDDLVREALTTFVTSLGS